MATNQKKRSIEIVDNEKLKKTVFSPEESSIEYPFEVNDDDHCETPLLAYEHLAPYLDRIALSLGKTRKDLCIYDPFYCEGNVVSRLTSLGFENVINRKEDFYQVVENQIRYLNRMAEPETSVASNEPEKTMKKSKDNKKEKKHKRDKSLVDSDPPLFTSPPTTTTTTLPPSSFSSSTSSPIPQYDVFLTNPPYSSSHFHKLLTFLTYLHPPQLPFFLLVPNYVYTKDFYYHFLTHHHPSLNSSSLAPSNSSSHSSKKFQNNKHKNQKDRKFTTTTSSSCPSMPLIALSSVPHPYLFNPTSSTSFSSPPTPSSSLTSPLPSTTTPSSPSSSSSTLVPPPSSPLILPSFSHLETHFFPPSSSSPSSIPSSSPSLSPMWTSLFLPHIFYLSPSHSRYQYTTPKGRRQLKSSQYTAPFPSFWYCFFGSKFEEYLLCSSSSSTHNTKSSSSSTSSTPAITTTSSSSSSSFSYSSFSLSSSYSLLSTTLPSKPLYLSHPRLLSLLQPHSISTSSVHPSTTSSASPIEKTLLVSSPSSLPSSLLPDADPKKKQERNAEKRKKHKQRKQQSTSSSSKSL